MLYMRTKIYVYVPPTFMYKTTELYNNSDVIQVPEQTKKVLVEAFAYFTYTL